MEQDNKPYQVRIFLKEEFAKAVRQRIADEAALKTGAKVKVEYLPEGIKPLTRILEKHDAKIDHNQFDEFRNFVVNALDDWENGPILEIENAAPGEQKEHDRKLAILTTTSLLTDEKRPFFKREFTLAMNGKTTFTGNEADALIADLETLGDGPVLTGGTVFIPNRPSRDVGPVRKSFVPMRHPGT